MSRVISRYIGVTNRPGKGPVGNSFAGEPFPPFMPDLSEAYFVKGGSVLSDRVTSPYADDAMLVNSYCASGGGYGVVNYGLINSCGDSGCSAWSFEAVVNLTGAPDESVIASEYETVGNKRGWGLRLDGTAGSSGVKMQLGDSSGNFIGSLLNLPGVFTPNCKMKISFAESGANGVFSLYINDAFQSSVTMTGQNKVYTNGASFRLFAFSVSGVDTSFFNGSMCGVKITSDATLKLYSPLQGSTYDLISEGPGIISGTINLFNRQNTFHYNINNGFDLYKITGSDVTVETNRLYVPYVDGSPVVTSVAGYEKVTENPAGNWHNQCETQVELPATSELFDKSNVAMWPAVVRARTDYDSSNPTRWSGWELSAYNLTQDGLGLDAENRVFSASTPNEYVYLDGNPQVDPITDTPFVADFYPLTKVQSVLGYATAKAAMQIKKIMNYVKSLVGL